MQALNCNRCGAFEAIDQLSENATVFKDPDWVVLAINGWMYSPRQRQLPSGMITQEKHLCPECSKALSEFINNQDVTAVQRVRLVRG